MLDQKLFKWSGGEEVQVGTFISQQVVQQDQCAIGIASDALVDFLSCARVCLGGQAVFARSPAQSIKLPVRRYEGGILRGHEATLTTAVDGDGTHVLRRCRTFIPSAKLAAVTRR